MLGNIIGTTPFGRRSMTLAMMKVQSSSSNIADGKTIDKWKLYRSLCEGKTLLGVSDRTLAVLNALLSFYPEPDLNEQTGLIVFPSNAQLSLRSHGMASATLRRHLTALIDAGLITRRDSPNGKRYARKGRGGEMQTAFGFSLAPLLARSEEIDAAARKVIAERDALKQTREQLTLCRRDISKLIEIGVTECKAIDWASIHDRFRSIVDRIPRTAQRTQIEPLLEEMYVLKLEIDKLLENHINSQNMSANESHIERHYNNSETNSESESIEPLAKAGVRDVGVVLATSKHSTPDVPLPLLLRACHEIADYSPHPIRNWRDFVYTTRQIGRYIGISDTAYEQACDSIGHQNTAIAIACIFSRREHIQNAGGYLRSLTDRAKHPEFTIAPMLQAVLKDAERKHTATRNGAGEAQTINTRRLGANPQITHSKHATGLCL